MSFVLKQHEKYFVAKAYRKKKRAEFEKCTAFTFVSNIDISDLNALYVIYSYWLDDIFAVS